MRELFKCIILVALLLFFRGLEAQENTKAIVDSLAHKMFVDVSNLDYDAILEMSHPKIFDLAPKESIKEVFKSMFEGNEEFTIELPKDIPEYTVSEVFKDSLSNSLYAFISYDMGMKMTFKNQTFDDESKDVMIKMMGAQGMNVSFVSDNALNIVMPNSITILFNDESTANRWVMVNYDADSPLFYQVLSKDLIEETKNYHQALMLDSMKN